VVSDLGRAERCPVGGPTASVAERCPVGQEL